MDLCVCVRVCVSVYEGVWGWWCVSECEDGGVCDNVGDGACECVKVCV